MNIVHFILFEFMVKICC